ncbi:Mitochondrial calcium uniporter regulator 1 [Lamellibrachia satsuma]|nr:Mitochondrial calcium uniporter regulator 1 [Lamellibrachia satsuma]
MAAPIATFRQVTTRLGSSALSRILAGDNISKSHYLCRQCCRKLVFSTPGTRGMCYNADSPAILTSSQMLTFDTHALVRKLENGGMETLQAEVLVEAFVQIVQSNLDHMNKIVVTKAQQEIGMQQVMSHLSAIKKDMIVLEKSEFSTLRHDYEKQEMRLLQLEQRLQDEVSKVKSGMLLDMNLERSRATESHALSEKAITQLQNKMDIEQSHVDKTISILDKKIDKEVANLLATFERYRNDVIKYAAGAVMTCLTLCLGFFRLWS